MVRQIDYRIEEAKYLVNRFITCNETPGSKDVPKNFIYEMALFHNFCLGYLVSLVDAKNFCKTGNKVDKSNCPGCNLCPYRECCGASDTVRRKETLK